MSRNVLQSSLLNAGLSIIFQVLCRIVTFGINAFIVRNVGREVLGIMNVRLLLLESTVLFLSREAINRAALSATSQQREKCSWAQLINQQWLTVPICIAISLPCVYIWLNWLSAVDAVFASQYRFACYAVALSCVIELCAEAPVFIIQVFCFVKLKVILNTLHIFVRSVVFLWIVLGNGTVAIYAFAIAQLVSAFTILLSHYGFFAYYIKLFEDYKKSSKDKKESDWKPKIPFVDASIFDNMQDFPFRSLKQFLPGVMINRESFFNSELQVLTLSFVKQGVLKQILTEGEKYVMSMSPVLSFSEQATYDVVNNLGSLAARFIFRPIEESSYFYFTQTIARDVALQEQDKKKVQQAAQVLSHLSLVVSSIGLLALVFGQSYAHTVLLLYGGADFVADGLPVVLLKWHCLAIYFLAVNGITEGYMFATNTSQDIDKYNYLMAIFSVSFLVLSYVLTSIFGPVGFIFANCINMFSRICFSTRFIWLQYKPLDYNPLKGFMPKKLFLVTLIFVGIVCQYFMFNISIIKHLALGVVSVLIVLAIWSYENQELIKLGWSYKRNKLKAL
ncbi:RFT1-like protein [Lucilia cuprina]|uniref:Protein RFT1 homolog n=1 Tax=Lucilia cuprina TaxID=7375 RepID=A0A0L0C4S4_LUCCU|nr:Protein RFT1 like protein [Lucilia cuprina]KNC27305.1 RFT1-like protein [Lucilia cuprina]